MHFLKDLVVEQHMDRDIKKFGDILNTTSAVYFEKYLRKNKCCNGLKMMKDSIYYFFCKKQAKNKAHLFYSNPDVQTAISVKYLKIFDFLK